jgi:hypothetical protein
MTWLDKLDAAFFTFSALSAAWLAFLLVDEGARRGWQALLLVVFWVFFTYLFLPRVHRILTRLYVPGYFIGRARTSDGLLGDPVNLAMLGSEPQVHQAMTTAGWTRADDLDLRSGRKIVTSTLRRRSYPQAPVSPLVLFDRQQDFAYQQEVAGSPSKRHHVRFWRCPDGWMLPGGYAVDWLAAGTYDRAVGLSLFTLQITHKIEENTDVERDFIVASVTAADPAVHVAVIENFSTGYHTRNGGGDRIETDGHLPIVDLGAVDAPPATRTEPTDSRMRRPAPTTFGALVTLVRGLLWFVVAFALLYIPATYLDMLGSRADRIAADGLGALEVTFAVILIGAAVVDCGLAFAVLAGRNWARVVLMSACVVTTVVAFVSDLRGTDVVSLHRLPAVSLSILVLLALSSHRSRDFALQRWTSSG